MAYLAQRYVSGKSKPGWEERWGNLPPALHKETGSRPRVWVHAVSAGEVVAATPILREMRELLPTHDFFLSVMTSAGHEMAEQQAASYVNGLFYVPMDAPWVTRKVVDTIRPQVFVSLESELWPNLLHELKRQGCRTIMVNGRISEKSYRRSLKYAHSLFRWMLGNMDRLLMQSEPDAKRIRDLGQIQDAEKIVVVGNSKFDQEIARLTPEQCRELRQNLHLPETAPVFVAGSTRSAEEEAEVIAAYQTMRAQVPDLCLIIAPRQIDRAPELAAAMQAAGLSPLRRSETKREKEKRRKGEEETEAENSSLIPHPSSLILDTMGELANVYAVATLAFVGNSFAPVVKGGGQNLLQPLAHGKPVLFGPHIATIRAEAALAIEAGVGFKVADGAELAARGLELLQNAKLQAEIAVRALDLIAANRGVSRRYAEMVAEIARASSRPFENAVVTPRDRKQQRARVMAAQSVKTDADKQAQNKRLETYLLEVARGKPGLGPSLLRGITGILAPVYCAGLKTYLLPYNIGVRKRKRLPCPVICVGNLTTGGTGKTPMTQMLCRHLQEMGRQVVVLSRGYGGANEYGSAIVSDTKQVLLTAQQAGDEAFLLASTLPGVPVVVGKDRRITGELAVQSFAPDIIVLDDGMQFWQLHRDLDIVLLNACAPFDNGWTFPRGLLREPPSHLRRAGIIVLTNARRVPAERLEELRQQLGRIAPGKLVFTADLTPVQLRTWNADAFQSLEWLQSRSIAALSALGNPESFETTLENLGANIVSRFRFRDHQAIGAEDLQRVISEAQEVGVEAIVTTAKDAVKIAAWECKLPLLVLDVAMQVDRKSEFLNSVSAKMFV